MKKTITPEEALETIQSLKGSTKQKNTNNMQKKLVTYVVAIMFLAIVNGLTSPSYWRVVRPALGRWLGLVIAFFSGKDD